MDVLVWLIGLVLAVVMIVAQCQLFAIRRLLERIAGPEKSAAGAQLSQQRVTFQPQSPEQVAKDRRQTAIIVTCLLLVLIAVVASAVIGGSPPHP